MENKAALKNFEFEEGGEGWEVVVDFTDSGKNPEGIPAERLLGHFRDEETCYLPLATRY